MKNSWGYMFLDNFSAIYTDNTKEGKPNNQYTFVSQGDGTYKIGLSNKNATFTATDYPTAFLGVNKAKKDTRLYFCDYENGDEQESDCQLVWYFVTPDDYTAYVASIIIYNAAMELGEQITIAKATVGVDADVLSASEALYNNTSSTAEAMTTQAQKLRDAIMAAAYYVASLDHPVEVLANQNIATDFSDEQTTGWTSTTNAQNKGAGNGNNAKDYSVTGNHYENWNDGAMSVGKVSATAVKLPAGVYRFEALAFTSTGAGLNLYAGAAQKPVTSTLIDIESPTEVYTYCGGGEMEIGLNLFAKGPNWIGLDNVQLYYLGDSDESYEKLLEEIMLLEPDYEALFDDEEACAQASVRATYTAAKNTVESAQTSQARAQAVDDFMAASKAMASSVAAYGAYKKVFDEATDFVGSTTSESTEVALLSDYIGDDEKEEGAYNGNGGALYVLENALLNDEQITAELAYLNKLFLDAKANAKEDGDDCTDLLQNPNFAESGGWLGVSNTLVTWPVGNTELYPVMQADNVACDIYQELTGMQNGLYELTLQAAFRPGDVYSEGYEAIATAYAYLNGFETKIPSGNLPDVVTLNEATEASTAFNDGTFPVTVYGLVTDGTLRVGITNKVRTVENCRLWAGGVQLTFRDKNKEVLQKVVEITLPQANALLNNYCGQPELDDLSAAISDVQSTEDLYHAFVRLKNAEAAVEAGTTTYANFLVALNTLSEAIENNTTASQVTINNAQSLLSTAQQAYEDKTYSTEEAEQAINDLKAAAVSVKMGCDVASEENPVDYTSAIINSDFDPEKGDKNSSYIEGWETTAMNGYKENTVSYNKKTFVLSQALTGLPKGKYKVTVQAYYRAGSYEEEEENINNGKDTHLAKFYANTTEKNYEENVMNLSEGGTETLEELQLPADLSTKYKVVNYKYVPDGTSASVACYKAGLYVNELEFFVGEDGKVTIGMKLDETIGSNDYVVVGPWHLWYMGDPDAASEEKDVTSLIVNPDFDPEKGDKNTSTIEGWETTSLNGYKENTASYNKKTFSLSQALTGLPKGKYKVTVQAYYRAGSYEEEEANIQAGKDTHLTKFYATTSEDTYEKAVMNLSEGGTETLEGLQLPADLSTKYKVVNGKYVPDGTSASVACYKAGLYVNELEFFVGEDGKATIGMHLDATIGSNDYVVVGPWHLYYYGEVKALDEKDVTNLIVNNDFDPEKGDKNTSTIEGWETTSLNGYKENTASYNKKTFALSQVLTGLPEGTYKVTVQAYYRAGSYEEEEANIQAGKDTHLTKFYATTSEETYEKAVMNLSEGGTETLAGLQLPADLSTKYKVVNGKYVPDGTSASVACYKAGLYVNELPFYVGSDGNVTIGMHLDTTIGSNDYVVVGPWHLYYYGAGNKVADIGYIATGVEEVEAFNTPASEFVPVAYYSLSGTRLAAPQRGFNIVKYSNGLSKKVLIP